MSAVIPLGTFTRVALRDAWPTEDGNFTPWLAQAESIRLLGQALDMELEVEAVEHLVGAFRADILAKAVDELDHRVLIENQFGRTDHNHLGQLLTYLSGIEGTKTIVWIAERIQPDHRAAIDWLNTNTAEPFSFFALEMELWRIGDSAPAPRFNVVASPNDWTRSVRSATRQVTEDGELADRHRIRIAYWNAFSEFLKEKKSRFAIRRLNKDHWFEWTAGRSGFVISATISTEKERIGVELYVRNDVEKRAFKTLFAEKQGIQKEFGEELTWQELPTKKASRIALYRFGVDPSDAANYADYHSWMLQKMERFALVFSRRIRELKLPPASFVPAETSED